MNTTLNHADLSKSYLEPLLAGDRDVCRKLIESALDDGRRPPTSCSPAGLADDGTAPDRCTAKTGSASAA